MKPGRAARSSKARHGIVFVVIVLVVLAGHLVVAQRWREAFGDGSTMAGAEPARMSVAYVREMQPSEPVPQVAGAAPEGADRGASSKRWVSHAAQAALAAQRAASEAARERAQERAREEEEARRQARQRELERARKDAQARREREARLAREAEERRERAEAAEAASAASATLAGRDGAADAAASAASASSAESAVAAASDAASPAARPFQWPASTRLSYVLTGNYRGEIHGSAQVEWIHDGPHYQVHLDVVVGADFAPLFTRKMSSDGRITAQGLAPRRYDEDSKLAFSDRRFNALRFEGDVVQLADGSRVPRPGAQAVQDSASQFVQLTWLFSTHPELLRAGQSVRFPLALPKAVDTWVYEVLDSETLSTPFGALEALHVKPRSLDPDKAAKAGALGVEIWFAPTLAYLPVRIVIHQGQSTYIDLMISRLPQMAAPAPTPAPAQPAAN